MKLLYVLGNALPALESFGTEAHHGNTRQLIKLITQLRNDGSSFHLLLDVQDLKFFPKGDALDFWETFTPHGANRLTVIMHCRDPEIFGRLSEQRSKYLLNGVVYIGTKLIDGSPLRSIENSIIVYSLFLALDQIQDSGVISIRCFLPDGINDVGAKITRKYQDCYQDDTGESIPEMKFIDNSLDESEFILDKIRYDPYEIEIDSCEKIDTLEETVNRIITEHFNQSSYQGMRAAIESKDLQKSNNIAQLISPDHELRGSGKKLKEMQIRLTRLAGEMIPNMLTKLKNSKESFDKVEKEVRAAINKVIEDGAKTVNPELEDYHESYKKFLRFLRNFPKHPFIAAVILVIIFAAAMIWLDIHPVPAFVVPALLVFAWLTWIWQRKKKRKKSQIEDLLDQASNQLIKTMDNGYKKIARHFWEQRMLLTNLKLGQIYRNYLTRLIHALKLATDHNPSYPLTVRAENAPAKLIFPAVTVKTDEDFTLEPFRISLGLDVNDLQDYFFRQYIKMVKKMNLAAMDNKIKDRIRDFCTSPQNGLVWDPDDINLEDATNRERVFYHPEDYVIPGSFALDPLGSLMVKKYELPDQGLPILFCLTSFGFRDQR